MNLENYNIHLIEGGTAEKIIYDFFKQTNLAVEKLQKLLGEYGQIKCYIGCQFAGISAPKNPAPKIFKKDTRTMLWVPRMNTKIGQEMNEKIKNICIESSPNRTTGSLILSGNTTKTIPSKGLAYTLLQPQFFGDDPYFLIIPKGCDDVKLVDGLRAIRLSEYYQILEESKEVEAVK